MSEPVEVVTEILRAHTLSSGHALQVATILLERGLLRNEAREERMREALEEIANHMACSVEKLRHLAPNMYEGQYGIGVQDGHRLCARIARAALEEKR